VSKLAKDKQAAFALQRLLEIVPDAMLAISRTGVVAFANQAAAKLFGYTHSELIGKPADLLAPARSREMQRTRTASYFEDRRNGRSDAGLRLLALRKTGEEFLAEVSYVLVAGDHLLSLTIRDVSNRARAEREPELLGEVERAPRLDLRDFRRLITDGDLAEPVNGHNGDTNTSNGNGNGNGQMAGELRASRQETIERLAMAIELRDPETGRHVNRIAAIGAFLGSELGFDEEHAQLLLAAAPMHDVGKIGISDEILLKRGKLTRRERAEMQRHTTIGYELLSGSTSEFLRLAALIALTHHERWDGSGYPDGLAGEEIPLVGRIAAICDVFDALISERPYKRAWPLDEAVAEIERGSGSHFDPALVEKFLEIVDRTPAPAAAPDAGAGFPAELLLDTVSGDAVDRRGHS
jgi:PAS domain S-box-containing protein